MINRRVAELSSTTVRARLCRRHDLKRGYGPHFHSTTIGLPSSSTPVGHPDDARRPATGLARARKTCRGRETGVDVRRRPAERRRTDASSRRWRRRPLRGSASATTVMSQRLDARGARRMRSMPRSSVRRQPSVRSSASATNDSCSNAASRRFHGRPARPTLDSASIAARSSSCSQSVSGHAYPTEPSISSAIEPVQLDRVLHRQFLDERFEEAVDDHRRRFDLGEAAAHDVEQLLFADLGHRGLVLDAHVLGVDLHGRIGVRARLGIHEQRVAAHVGLHAVAAFVHLDEAAIRRAAAALAHRLARDDRRGVRRRVHHLRTGVLMLAGSA